ncbi:TMEM43 family protein [Sulfuriroseicoccus oceanibius]|uniref:TMEM43 family protein n=1 Tax=Sulfuriroseicoccus oceanibius TaxID=2707525 RepID=A0A6B3L7D7_9BACT|nr:TMEM43 family protein [Sulfuriroseicoccus oceanibius]QQL46302.1 TMEM43 family protein [Sulfuriroseicoccus oceanibius]
MSDTFTEVTSTSWFSRIGSSIKGIFVGLVLIVIAVVLLGWNEGRSVERYKTLKEGGGAVLSVASDSIDSSHDGQLVHTSGLATSDDRPADPEFGLSTGGLKLVRTVEMYQWKENEEKETRKKLGGGTETVTTYSYVKEWSEQLQRSADFKQAEDHVNPTEMRVQSARFTAKPVTLGAYTLADHQVSKINGAEGYTLPADYQVPATFGQATASGSTIFIGADPAAPVVGDLRVSFQEVPEQEVSVVAAQVSDTFEPYQTEAGGTISLLERGTVSAKAMFETAQENNKVMTWVLRVVGLVMMFIGFNMLMAPLSVLADVVPFIGNLVGAGTAFVALLLAAVTGLITIAVAWIVFRPVLAVALLVGAGVCVYLIFGKSKKAKAA